MRKREKNRDYNWIYIDDKKQIMRKGYFNSHKTLNEK